MYFDAMIHVKRGVRPQVRAGVRAPVKFREGFIHNRRVRFAAVSALVLLWSAALGADTYPRQPGVDAIHYVFRLALGDASDEIAGETTVTVKFATGGLREVALDLASRGERQGNDGQPGHPGLRLRSDEF